MSHSAEEIAQPLKARLTTQNRKCSVFIGSIFFSTKHSLLCSGKVDFSFNYFIQYKKHYRLMGLWKCVSSKWIIGIHRSYRRIHGRKEHIGPNQSRIFVFALELAKDPKFADQCFKKRKNTECGCIHVTINFIVLFHILYHKSGWI